MDGDKRKQLESILENMKKENEQQQASPPRTPPPQQPPPPDHRGGWGDSPPKQRRNSGSGPGSMYIFIKNVCAQVTIELFHSLARFQSTTAFAEWLGTTTMAAGATSTSPENFRLQTRF